MDSASFRGHTRAITCGPGSWAANMGLNLRFIGPLGFWGRCEGHFNSWVKVDLSLISGAIKGFLSLGWVKKVSLHVCFTRAAADLFHWGLGIFKLLLMMR